MIPIYPDYRAVLQRLQPDQPSTHRADAIATLEQMKATILKDGDQGVWSYTTQFDGVTDTSLPLQVTKDEITQAYDKVPSDFVTAVQKASDNIRAYHEKQKPVGWIEESDGIMQGMKVKPIERVGLYVPGGRAPYPSTVMMDAIPAQIAGVDEIYMATPPLQDGSISPQILVAADVCGVSTLYRMGGAQAIFALAYGTSSVTAVDKIVGPGNVYVTLAKQMVYGKVDIDKPAGPSEALVYVEDPAYVSFAAAELLAQLEHDPDTSAVGIAPSEELLTAIQQAMTAQVEHCSRRDIIEQAVQNSALFVSQDRSHALEIMNAVASEHVVLLLDDYQPLLEGLRHAGAIFCGPYTPVALGDYFGGPNHVLPTSGAARFSSPLSVMDFMTFSSVLGYTKSTLQQADPYIKSLTEMEGFDAHYRSVSIRTT